MAVTSLRLDRIALVSADPDALADFYRSALGFERADDAPPSASMPEAGRTVSLRLGDQRLDLVAPVRPGAPYPGDVPGWSPLFQHCAIIVSDMAVAHARLCGRPGWRPISLSGPERLPAASGGVTAFKFRDPEGHPLELLAFPTDGVPDLWRRPGAPDVCLGIDHTAISVADTARSRAFYEGLGFRVIARSHNVGPEQARMDAVPDADVCVTGLGLSGEDAPHLELLGYHGTYDRPKQASAPDDIAATRIVLACADAGALTALCAARADHVVAAPQPGGGTALLRDPDGHLLLLKAP